MAKGQSAAVQAAQKLEWKREEEMIDALGNVVKIKAPPKKLSRQEQKKKAKAREMRRKAGEVVSESEDEMHRLASTFDAEERYACACSFSLGPSRQADASLQLSTGRF